jgi:hypothetical protein
LLDTEYTDLVAGMGSGFGNPWRQGQDQDGYSLEASGVDEEAGGCGIMISGEQFCCTHAAIQQTQKGPAGLCVHLQHKI